MTAFIQQLLGCDHDEARRVQKGYFHEHGTTLAGLMALARRRSARFPRFRPRHRSRPDLGRSARGRRRSTGLPGRKFVFTNGDEAYARRVLDQLGLANAFDGLHDIHAMDYVPKPDPRAYAEMCERHAIEPERGPVRRGHGAQP